VAQLQCELRKWGDRNFPKEEAIDVSLKVQEEVGELAKWLKKQREGVQSLHFKGRRTTTDELQMDAVGDIAITLIRLCSLKGWSFRRILQETWREIGHRDYRECPVNGCTE
jgi:NTP pyrophosphatase (non-canonical NTP hydrolase)